MLAEIHQLVGGVKHGNNPLPVAMRPKGGAHIGIPEIPRSLGQYSLQGIVQHRPAQCSVPRRVVAVLFQRAVETGGVLTPESLHLAAVIKAAAGRQQQQQHPVLVSVRFAQEIGGPQMLAAYHDIRESQHKISPQQPTECIERLLPGRPVEKAFEGSCRRCAAIAEGMDIGKDHPRFRHLLQHLHLGGYLVIRPVIILIEKGDDAAPTVGQRQAVAGGDAAPPSPGVTEHLQLSGKSGGKIFQNGAAAVGRAVIDRHNFQMGIMLPGDAIQRCGEISPAVVERQNNRNQRVMQRRHAQCSRFRPAGISSLTSVPADCLPVFRFCCRSSR